MHRFRWDDGGAPIAYDTPMKAVVLDAAGPEPTLRDAEIPDPRPGPGEALLRVAACGFSHHDALIMEGTLRRGITLPRALGHEAAGVVCAVGDGADAGLIGATAAVIPGDVGHRRDGGFAEMLVAPADSLILLPAAMDAADGAMLVSPTGVALKALDACGLTEDQTIIVTGVSGGVGGRAAQAASAVGARLIGITGSAEKARRLQDEPWIDAVLLESEPWEEAVAALTDGRGADAALDATGAALGRLAASVRRGGRIALAGQVGRGEVPFAPAEAIFRELMITGSLGAERRHAERAVELTQRGLLPAFVHETLPLSAASVAAAYHALKRREAYGRILLRP